MPLAAGGVVGVGESGAGGGVTLAHDFAASLAASHAASDWPGWEALYRDAFPTFAAMIDHRADGEHQRAGIDRSVILRNSKQILIDEKVRGTNKRTGKAYDDILLETVSVRRNGRDESDGWVRKAIRADYIAYLIGPLGRAWLLPVIQLQSAWAQRGEEWTRRYGERRAPNLGYETISVPVPEAELLPAIGSCLRARFEPWEPSDA